MVKMRMLVAFLSAVGAALLVASAATADTVRSYQATYVEPVGGPNGSPFACPPGTSCGSASVSGIGHASYQLVEFNAYGFGQHRRTVYFDDGSTLTLRVVDEVPFGFAPPGNAGQGGYIGFPNLAGNPQQLDVEETIVAGTGRLAGATGGGSGTVSLRGGIATGKTSGTITLP